MMMSMSAKANDLLRNDNHIISQDQMQQSIIIDSSCPISWKLYTNPFFASTNTPNNGTSPLKLKHLQRKYSASAKYIQHLQSDNKMSSCTSSSENQLQQARTQVAALKAELEIERELRKKMEMLNKKLSKELADQAEKSKANIYVCEELEKKISRLKEEMAKMKKDMQEERKMLRIAEVFREKRVQMKLADAQLFYHHKLVNQILPSCPSTLTSSVGDRERSPTLVEQQRHLNVGNVTTSTSNSSSNGNIGSSTNGNGQRKASPEAENPHIKQGIKGFVEFQRAINGKNGSNNSSSSSCSSVGSNKLSRDLGSYNKLECQKAQYRVFLKHKGPLPYSHNGHLILS